jgi:hypothetical protein
LSLRLLPWLLLLLPHPLLRGHWERQHEETQPTCWPPPQPMHWQRRSWLQDRWQQQRQQLHRLHQEQPAQRQQQGVLSQQQ